MLHSKTPTTLLSLLTALLASTHQTSATPYHRDVPESLDSPAILVDRACPVPCGWQSQLCCTANQRCYTDSAGQAQCGALAADAQGISTVSGAWQYYTSTWVETDLLTRSSVYSTYIPGPTAAGVNCNFALLELPCGNICCQAGQVCQVLGQCVASGGGSSGFYSSNYGSFSAPLRPTSGSPTTVTSFATPTATVPFLPPIGSASGIVYGAAASHKLSGGAIAGIVIGVLAGIVLLLMICFYCCLRSSFDHVLAIFGLGPRRRTSETVIEEHHHASGGGGWFGRPSGVVAAERPSRTGGWGGVAAALAALAVMLGLKRRHSSYGSKSSYTYTSSSYDTSESRWWPSKADLLNLGGLLLTVLQVAPVLVGGAHVATLAVIIREGCNEMKSIWE